MTKDWGYAALLEHGGKRILFDTGNNATSTTPQASVIC